jgi:hypothetical protein
VGAALAAAAVAASAPAENPWGNLSSPGFSDARAPPATQTPFFSPTAPPASASLSAPGITTQKELQEQRHLRETYASLVARHHALTKRTSDARDRLLQIQIALAEARRQAEVAGSASSDVRALERAVAAKGEAVEVLRAALNADEAALAERLTRNAQELAQLRAEADAAAAALRAARLDLDGAGDRPGLALDLSTLQHNLQVVR